jgi:hypothetical protein
MARPRLWSVLSAWSSVLGLASIAFADATRSIELPVAIPVEVSLPGVDQVVSADPAIVRADLDTNRGVLTLTGVALARQSVVYAWTPGGLLVFVAKVVAPPDTPRPKGPGALAGGAAGGTLYRLTVGGGLRRRAKGTSLLPFTFGASGSNTVNAGNRVDFRGHARPFADDNDMKEATGSAIVEWTGDRYRAAFGDQPVDVAPHVAPTFPLRGLTASGPIGPVAVTLFGGTRATPAFRLVPYDDDPLPSLLGGVKLAWAPTSALTLSGAFAVSRKSPIASVAAEWASRGWLAGFEAASTDERMAAVLRVRRELERVTVDHRFVFRTPGLSAFLPGSAGLTSETALTWALSRDLTALARVTLTPSLGGDRLTGGWHLGGRWAPGPDLIVGLSAARTLDGATFAVGGAVDVRTKLFGDVSMAATRMLQQRGAKTSELWQQSLRAEKPVALGAVSRVFVEETLTLNDVHGALTLVAGADVEHGWLRASVAPGFVIPTVTDPNGIAETLRLRITAAPSPGFQVYADARQTFGAKLDTSVHMGIGLGLGPGGAWDALASWLPTESVQGVVFVDQNGNGVHDTGEPTLPGVRIQLDGERSVVTDAAGRYRFSGLKRGSYRIAIDRAAMPANLRLASASPVNVTLPGGPREIAFVFAGAGSIHGVIFNDLALSGRFSGVEPGIAAELVIDGPGGRRVVSATGSFSVGGLAPGRYRLTVDALSLPPAYVIDTPDVELELQPGDVRTAQFPVLALRALQVVACRGQRPSAQCDTPDAPVPGLKVRVGTAVSTTDSQGRAMIRQLPAGTVTLSIDPTSIPAGWMFSGPLTLDLPETPTTLPVTIRLTPAGR